MTNFDFKSHAQEEIQDFIGVIYAENLLTFTSDHAPPLSRISGVETGVVSITNNYHSHAFKFVAGSDRDSVLILTCLSGHAWYWHGRERCMIKGGLSLPISASGDTGCETGKDFAHISVHISTTIMETFLNDWCGTVPTTPLIFELKPFASGLSSRWQGAIRLLEQALLPPAPEAPAGLQSLQEHMIALLLELHPHNLDVRLKQGSVASRKPVGDAETYMATYSDMQLTVADVAREVGCTVIALNRGFAAAGKPAPRAYLYNYRIAHARHLAQQTTSPTPIDVFIRQSGFINVKRFEELYAFRYGERIERTLAKASGSASGRQDKTPTSLTREQVDLVTDHVERSLGSRLTSGSLATYVGMQPWSFARAFEAEFGTTPAKYVLQKRVTRAQWLLQHTELPIAAVAAETGFSSQSHLTTTLKSKLLETPNRIRLKTRLDLGGDDESGSDE